MSVYEQLNALLNAPTMEALWDCHARHMEEKYGFDRLIYGHTRFRTETSLGDPEDFVLLTTHGPEYIEWFIGQGFYHHGPMVHWALENEGACSWSVLLEMLNTGTLTDQERTVMQVNQKHGVLAGYSISFKSVSPRSKGAIALTSKVEQDQAETDAIWAEHGNDIMMLNNVAHLRILSLPYQAPGRSLTRRQREVLEWVGDGKTVQDIALLMEVSPATVEKHLRLARESMAVETTAQAVLKASFHNRMFILE